MKGEELRAAEAHIARLEEELLLLKDVKHDCRYCGKNTDGCAAAPKGGWQNSFGAVPIIPAAATS